MFGEEEEEGGGGEEGRERTGRRRTGGSTEGFRFLLSCSLSLPPMDQRIDILEEKLTTTCRTNTEKEMRKPVLKTKWRGGRAGGKEGETRERLTKERGGRGRRTPKRLLRRLSLLSFTFSFFSFSQNHTPRSQPCRSSPAPFTRRQASPASSAPRPARAPAGECCGELCSRFLVGMIEVLFFIVAPPPPPRVDRRGSGESLAAAILACSFCPLSLLLCPYEPLLRRSLRLFEPSDELEAKKSENRGGGWARGGIEKRRALFFCFPLSLSPQGENECLYFFLQPPQGTQAPRRMPSSFQPLADPDEVHELALSRKSEALGHWTTSGGAAKGRREGGKSGGRRSRSALDSFFRAAGSAHPNWNLKLQPNNQTNRPVAYAPAEKERSANANAIKFAADLLAGGVAGGISKTGAFSNEDS